VLFYGSCYKIKVSGNYFGVWNEKSKNYVF
jgi:hypothetical protein